MRVIIHVDLDAFFPSVEMRENPELRGKPVIVGADPKEGKGRGVVSSASYEARELGVRSGMPISKAWKLCPHAIYLRPNFELYERVSNNIMKILRRYAEKFEQVGIDEAFLDVSNKVRDFEEARELAERIKREVLNKEKLTCSIGVGPNKLVAKIASDYRKPYGLTVVKEEDVKRFLLKLEVRKLPGVGLKTERRLKEMKIKTIGDLAKANVEELIKNFGILGASLHQLANGIDESEVQEEYEVKSIGREITFEEDTDEQNLIFNTIDELAKDIHQELLSNNFYFKTITVKVRYEDFETHTHSKSLFFPTNRIEVVKDVAKKLTLPFLQVNKKIRLIGVRVSNLVSDYKQKTLKQSYLKFS